MRSATALALILASALSLLIGACGSSSDPTGPGGGDEGGAGALDQDGAWTWINPKPFGSPVWRLEYVDADVAYAVGSGATVLKSVDGGASWDIAYRLYELIDEPTLNLRELHFLDAEHGFVVGDGGTVVRTTDGGHTWANVSAPTTAHLRDLYFFDADTGYVTGDRGVLYRTTNGGMTWTAVTHPAVNVDLTVVAFASVDEGWIAGEDAEVWKTADGGASWTDASFGVGGDIVMGRMMGDGRLALVNSFGGVFPSTTGGFTTAFFTADQILDVDFDDPDNGAVLYTEGGVPHVGTRHAGSWTHVALPLVPTPMSLGRGDGELTVGGWHGELVHSADDGAHWVRCDERFEFPDAETSQFFDVCFNSSGVGIAVGTAGLVMRSPDGGLSWTRQTSATDQDLWACWITDGGIAMAVGPYSEPVRSTDGGVTWSTMTMSLPLADRTLRDVSLWDDDNGLIVGGATDNKSYVLVTHDGGDTWTETGAGDDDTIITVCVYATGTQTAYVGCNPSKVLKTSDGGATWAEQESDLPFAIPQIMFVDADHGWALTQRNRYAWTTDGGATWTPSAPTNDTFWALHFADPMHGIGVASTGRIWTSDDGGVTWERSHAGWSGWSHVRGVWMRDASHAIIVGTELKIQVTDTGGTSPN